MRREIGTLKDGSLGGFGGNKYEGLGVRNVNYLNQYSNSIVLGDRKVKIITWSFKKRITNDSYQMNDLIIQLTAVSGLLDLCSLAATCQHTQGTFSSFFNINTFKLILFNLQNFYKM